MGKQSFSWSDIPEPNKPGSGNGKPSELYMKLEPDNKYRVRMFGDPVLRYFAWYNGAKYNVPKDLIEDFERHTGEVPRLYIVANIIDRNDTKNGKTRFKLLEKGTTVFSTMKTYQEETGISPGSDKAPDFLIKVIAGKERRNTKYEVMNLPGEAPFSEKEKELINRKDKLDPEELKKLPIGERGPIDLEALYDMDKGRKKVMELLDGTPSVSEDVSELAEEVEEKPVTNKKKVVHDDDPEEEENLDDLLDQLD